MIRPTLRRAVLCSFSALAACGGGAPATTPAPAAAASAPAPAPRARGPLHYSPGVTRYLISQHHHVDQTLPTGDQIQEIGLRTYVTAVITGPADSQGYGLSLTIDSILADSGTLLPPGIDLDQARGLRYDARLSPAGRMIDPRPSDPALAKGLSQLLGGFRAFYPRLPAAGVLPGALWTDSTELTDTTAAAVVKDQAVTHYQAGPWENSGGIGGEQLGIRLTEDFTVSGSGEAGGSTFALSGTGTRSGQLEFSAGGRFLGGITTDSAGIVISFDPQGLTVPRRQVSHTTITVLP